jgi:uncharacterized protein (TIGR02391 family)
MLITNDELGGLRQAIESLSGLDPELQKRCGQVMHVGAYDDAVRNAFVLLEEQLRQRVNQDGLAGVALVQHGFKPDGPLAKRLAGSEVEREGLRELYSGAFRLFRNPVAHGRVGHEADEAKSILGLVNLLLKILDGGGDTGVEFTRNLELALGEVKKVLGSKVDLQLRRFLEKCVQAGLQVDPNAKQWIGFRKHAWVRLDHWPKPKQHPIPLFYLLGYYTQMLAFPVRSSYRTVVGLNMNQIEQELIGMGLAVTSINAVPHHTANLKTQHDEQFLDTLFEGVKRISAAFERSVLEGKEGKAGKMVWG